MCYLRPKFQKVLKDWPKMFIIDSNKVLNFGECCVSSQILNTRLLNWIMDHLCIFGPNLGQWLEIWTRIGNLKLKLSHVTINVVVG